MGIGKGSEGLGGRGGGVKAGIDTSSLDFMFGTQLFPRSLNRERQELACF